MKRNLVSLLTLFSFIACQKDDKTADATKDALQQLQGKYLVCDSIKTTANGITTKQVLGKGKGWDISLGFYGNLEIYANPTVTKSYTYENPDKIYYWNNGTNYQPTVYYTIISVSGNKLVLKDTEATTGKIYTEYFTAE